MRILLAALDYPPGVTEGVARQRQWLAEALVRLGHSVHVVARGSERSDVEQNGVHVHRYAPGDVTNHFLAAMPVLDRPLTDAQWLAEAATDIAAREHIDIIDVPLWLAQPLAIVRRPPCAVAVWLQTSLLQLVELQGREPRPHEVVLADIDRYAMTHASGCIADSRSVLAEITRAYGLSGLADRTHVVHLGIPDAPVPARNRTGQGICEALIVGRLEQRKGTRFLLEHLPRLLEAAPNLHLRFVGRDNSAADGLRRETGRSYPEAFADAYPALASRVRFDGYLSDADLADAYASADLVLHPALYESFGLTFVEAMRASRPVVAWATGGALEVFRDSGPVSGSRAEAVTSDADCAADADGTGTGAWLVPVGDGKGLAVALRDLSGDADRRAAMGARGRERFAARFTSDRMAEQTAAAYAAILTRGHQVAAPKRRVFQVMEALQDRDAVSRITRTNAGILASLGAERPILSLFAEPSVRSETGRIRATRFGPNDAAIFHYWGFSRLEGVLARFPGRKALHYHNITPPSFFGPRTPHFEMTARGYAQLDRMADACDLVIGDSHYNVREYARHLTTSKPSLCLYPLVDADAMLAAPWDRAYAAELATSADGPIWLFVGRFAPNKRQDQLMRAFDRFVTLTGAGRLVMVGDVTAMPSFVAGLEDLRSALTHGERISIVPSVSDEALRACYRVASLFVCASEHEGFGVPLGEAMAFGVPIVALDRGAVGETVAGAGVCLEAWDTDRVATTAADLLESSAWLSRVEDARRRRLADFSRDAITDRLRAVVRFLRDGDASPLFDTVMPGRRPAPAEASGPMRRLEERFVWSTSMN